MDEIRRSRKDDRAGLHKAQTTLHGLTAFCVTTIKINLRVSDMSESLICLPLTHPPFHPFIPSASLPSSPSLLQQWSATAVKAPVGQHRRKTRRPVARQQQQKITMRARVRVCLLLTCLCACACVCVPARVLIIKNKHAFPLVGQCEANKVAHANASRAFRTFTTAAKDYLV